LNRLGRNDSEDNQRADKNLVEANQFDQYPGNRIDRFIGHMQLG